MDKFEHGYALLIGVGDTAYPGWSLPVTANDVMALKQVLVDPALCGYLDDGVHVRILTDSAATRTGILAELHWLQQRVAANPESTTLIYYSGHGWVDVSGNYYLIPHDGNLLPAVDFIAALRGLQTKRLLVFMDCCHAKGIRETQIKPPFLANGNSMAFPQDLANALLRGRDGAVFTSSQSKEPSQYLPNRQLSIYAKYLLEALLGAGNKPGDTLVTVYGLIHYLSRTVPESARQLRQAVQTPAFIVSDTMENFPVALLRGGKGLPGGGWAAVEARTTIERLVVGPGAVVARDISAPVATWGGIAAAGNVTIIQGNENIVGRGNTVQKGGIRARTIIAENVVDGVMASPGALERAGELVQLARAVERGGISTETELTAKQPASLTRYSEVSCPSHIQIHTSNALRVAITLKPTSENAVPLDLQAPPDFTTLKVDACLIVSPVVFDLQGSNIQTIEVPKDADSTPVIFKVIPKTLGRKTLAVEFFQDARYLDRAEVEITVEKEAEMAETVYARPALALHTQPVSPDLTIYIEEVALDKTRRLYRFLLLSPLRDLNLHFEEVGEIELKGEPAAYFADIFAELNAWLRQRNVNEAEFYGRLNSLGASLYERLFPEKLKRLYWEKLRDKVKSVQIISADPWIPWELVRPYHPETFEEDDFLCERFDLTRWLAGPASPDTLNFQRMALIVDAPKHGARAKEVIDLKQLPGIAAEDISPTLEAVYALLESRSFTGLHFACHGEYEIKNPDQSPLWLEGRQPLRPNDIVGKKRTFGREQPLVFLNACETGQSGVALTGVGGWARAFVKAGAAGFLGSLWEAQDESAYHFALAFYGYLLDGKTVAEAVRLARRDIRKAGDPTWLSYTVYANPLARLEQKV